MLFAVAGTAGPASAATSGACPSSGSLKNFKADSNVAASFTNSGSTTTYRFASLRNEHPVDGVPGLIKYCVYPKPPTQPKVVDATAKGANGDKWIAREGSGSFSFGRPGGNPSNIPLNGKSTTMGTATWVSLPTTQTILLHINDPRECTRLYGSGTSGTCFVKPSTGPICNHGNTGVAYNAMPFGVVNCYTAAQAFEATQTNEFGDEVKLASGTGTQLASLKVMFASYGCSVSGHWNTGATDPCVTAPGATFSHDITANIYDPGNLTKPIATVTVNQTIPFRPSASANCTGADVGKWFNSVAGRCQNSIGTVLTFNFPTAVSLPSVVVWTVAFNTTHFGTTPIGEGATCFSSAGGCGYDSLNVGATSFPGAPYAGTDVSEAEAFQSVGQPPGPLHAVTDYTGFRPLGEVITK
ncbi:MAG TPA: hypothetical protein VF834_00100 [Streptosporangiaceae bacterium]